MLWIKIALTVHALLKSGTIENHGRRTDWSWPPGVVIPLLVAAALYAYGTLKLWQKSKRNRVVAQVTWFALGWMSLVIALDSPIHEIGEQLFWVHMTQHEILMLAAAPLIVLGRPLVTFLHALPESWRPRIFRIKRMRPLRSIWAAISAPFSAWLISAMALWVWHAPWLFDKAVQSDWIHAAQHSTFFLTALLFWWPLVARKPAMGYGAGILYIFTTILHTTVLGALLTFATSPWYRPYFSTAPAWGLAALGDQQLGGLIMWIPGGTLLLVVALILLVRWLDESRLRWEYTPMAGLQQMSDGGPR